MTIDFSIFNVNERPVDLDAQMIVSRGVEADGVVRFFSGKKWQEITIDDLKNRYEYDFSACPAFMTPKAFTYYLPAFIKIIFNEFEEADVLSDAIIFNLLLMAEGKMADRPEEIERTWSREQMRLVGDFLKIIHEKYEKDYLENELDGDSKRAYDLLWGRY